MAAHAGHPYDLIAATVDLFPTIMDDPGLELGYRPDDRSVYAIRPDEPRFAFGPTNKYGHGFIEIRIDDRTDRRNSPLAVIGRAVDGRGAELDKP